MIVFYNDGTTTIRSMEKEDAEVLYEAYKSFGYHRDIATFKKYYEEQTSGKRKVFISEYQKEICGICTLIINSTTGPWAEMGLPEIVDLSVFLTHQRMGIGNKLLDVAENEASKIADTVFLAVGLHSGYGAAQRIYVKRGYNFDGTGLWYCNNNLEQYAPCNNDDDLLLYMSKHLKKTK